MFRGHIYVVYNISDPLFNKYSKSIGIIKTLAFIVD